MHIKKQIHKLTERDIILCAVISVAMLPLQFIVGFPIFKKTIKFTGDYSLLC